MASEEVQSLRDQVRRLNAIVAQYQENYPAFKPKVDHDKPTPPWQEDHKIISPLLKEYDNRIEELNRVIETFKEEHRHLRHELNEVINENEKLTHQLKDTVKAQLDQAGSHFSTSDQPKEEQLLANLQEQVQEATREKESAVQMWRQAMTEVERLQHLLASTRPNAQVAAWEAQATKLQEQFKRTVTDLTNENTILQEELRQTRTELHASQLQVAELRATLEDMKSRLRWQEQEKSFVSGNKKKADSQLSSLHQQQTELESLYAEAQRKISLLQKEKVALEDRVLMLKKKSKEDEDILFSFQQQVREGIQMVDDVYLEKDQAVEKEKQATEEVERLNAVINKLVDEAGARTRQEVDIIRQQCNQNIRRLMDELESLESTNNEKQAQIERAVRERRAAESELEKLQREQMASQTSDQVTLNHLQQRMFDAEQKKEEALLKVDNFQQQIKRMNMRHEQEAEQLRAEVDKLNDRVAELNRTNSLRNDERVKLIEQLDELKTKVHKLQLERDAAVREKSKEIILMEQELSERSNENEIKIQAMEDSHRRTVEELRQMLNAQQRLSAKWKEECNSITQSYDRKLRDLKEDYSREKKRCGELSRLLKLCTSKMTEAQQTLGEYSEHIQRMEERIRNTELHNSHSSKILRSQTSSKSVLEKRKQLQRELEKSLKEVRDNLTESACSLGPHDDGHPL